MKTNTINIAIAPNGVYVNYSLVLLQSIFDTNKGNNLCIYVLYNSLTEDEINKLSSFIKMNGGQAEFIYIEGTKYKVFNWKERFSVETYFRLELQDVLPAGIERILYLDIDMIVRKDLKELYGLDFEDKYIIASGFSPRCERGDEFNAGMILFNIEKIRKDGITFETYVDLAKKLNGNFYQDQGLLNELYGEKGTRYVSKQMYNFTCSFYRKFQNADELKNFDIDNIVIMHYAGPGIRPWQIRFEDEDIRVLEKKNIADIMASKGFIIDKLYFDLQKEWWQVANETPVYNELIVDMMKKKSEFYCILSEGLVESKEYSIGYACLKNIRRFYNKIHKRQ